GPDGRERPRRAALPSGLPLAPAICIIAGFVSLLLAANRYAEQEGSRQDEDPEEDRHQGTGQAREEGTAEPFGRGHRHEDRPADRERSQDDETFREERDFEEDFQQEGRGYEKGRGREVYVEEDEISFDEESSGQTSELEEDGFIQVSCRPIEGG